ncbi:uncharacterized protein LOC123698876 [Colias croceus]|uniref:uncharacterized protein LOC123698876 n=1 Tax=Colias crocea TaxID=72248 RepID=UPI001E27F9CA|nr:uncharacterized protein LOC123698876 [Colias croceus]
MMKIFLCLACIFAAVSAIPRPAVDEVQVASNYVPQQFRRDSIPLEIFRDVAVAENSDESYVPEAILVKFIDIKPLQPVMDDLKELIDDASRALQINPEIVQVADIPHNEGFHYEPIQVANLPINSNDAEKVMVVDSPAEIESDGEIPQVDSVQVVDNLPKSDAVAESNADGEVVKRPIDEEQNEAIQVASIPILDVNVNSPSDDEFRAVKFVDNSEMDGSDTFVAVPLAPSELDSLRVNFGDVHEEEPVNENNEKFSYYPLRLYPDPLLR